MNKKVLLILLFVISATTLMADCNIGIAMESSKTLTSGSDDTTTPPMFVLGTDHDLMQMVYWIDPEEPQINEDNAEFFEREHQEWVLQEKFRRNAAKYTKLIVDGTKTRDVKYVDEMWLNPDGEKMYLGELHSRPEIPSPCARFALIGKPGIKDNELPGNVLVTDSYLATHKPMEIKPASDDEILSLPPAVVKKMEEKYGMKAERSVMARIIGNRYTYGVLQFEGEYKTPVKHKDQDYKTALALEIITDGTKIYSYPVEGWYDPCFGPTWHADDGGEYFPGNIVAAFDGPQGPEFYFIHWAPESATTGLFMLRDGQFDCQEYTVYHSLVDEDRPVWKKDIAEMERLYVADDPHENKNVKLTKWAHVFIDYDSEQIWISDNNEENGAFFNREDGKLKLITTVRSGFKPAFPDNKDGNHYLMLSGSAGGPSYYTEVFTLRDGKVVESFNAMEIYGEIDQCNLNGKSISAEQGKAYLEAIPEVRDSYIFWHEINGQ